MGAKQVFRRYKNPFYFAIGIAISLFLFSCQHFSLSRALPSSVDTNEKKYLATTRDLILKNDFKSAARENQRMLQYFSRFTDSKDIITSNYDQNAQILSDLLTRIMDDIKKTQALTRKIQNSENRIKALALTVGSYKKKAAVSQKKLADRDKLIEKIKTLERQIERLKQIDLNSDKITGNPDKPKDNQPIEKRIPATPKKL